jgi:fumarate reductase subunit D
VISLFLFHAVHRIYHGLHDLGVHAGTGAMVAAYGSALAGTLIAAYLLIAVGF